MSADLSDARRDALHDFMQAQGPEHINGAAVLTGWVVVQEWMDDTGGKWLTKAHAASLATWSAKGFHLEAVHGDWPIGDDDDA